MKKSFLWIAAFGCLALAGCSKDDGDNARLSNKSYSLYHEDTQLIEGTDISDLTWDSENEFVATVEGNSVTGQFVGKTIVRSTTGNLSFSVEVKPRYNLYDEPCLDFGASKEEIKAKLGTPESEDATTLTYKTGNPQAPLALYMFENGHMRICGVLCPLSVADTIVDFLTERFLVVNVDMNKYSATFTHCHGKIADPRIDYIVGMKMDSSLGGIMIGYTPMNDSSRGCSDTDLEEALGMIANKLK